MIQDVNAAVVVVVVVFKYSQIMSKIKPSPGSVMGTAGLNNNISKINMVNSTSKRFKRVLPTYDSIQLFDEPGKTIDCQHNRFESPPFLSCKQWWVTLQHPKQWKSTVLCYIAYIYINTGWRIMGSMPRRIQTSSWPPADYSSPMVLKNPTWTYTFGAMCFCLSPI